MELRSCDAADAQRRMESCAESGLTTKVFYAQLQAFAGDRIFADQLPSYALDFGALDKAERDFDNTLSTQWLLHPYMMAKSFERYHVEQVPVMGAHGFNPRPLADPVWLSSHENTKQERARKRRGQHRMDDDQSE